MMAARIGPVLCRPSRGQGLAEFAIVFPVFVLLLLAVFDAGRLIWYYNTVSEAARNGARVAIVNQRASDICQVAANRAVGLGLPSACATSNGVDGVRVNNGGAACTEVNCVQTVRVRFTYRAITPIIGQWIGPVPLTSTTQVPVEALCATGSCPTP
jgi:Flp pilus assembly protein TadG